MFNVTKSIAENISSEPSDGDEIDKKDAEEDVSLIGASSDMLVELANIDLIRPYFWSKHIAIQILEMVVDMGNQNRAISLKVQRNLARCFGLLALHDQAIPQMVANLTTILRLIDKQDADLKLSTLTILGNIARGDSSCKVLLENKVCELAISVIECYQNDHRLIHMGLAVLRNLVISEANRIAIASKGAIVTATNSLKLNSPLIQYEAIGILKCLLSGEVPKDHITTFMHLGGIQLLVGIAISQTDNSETNQKTDPRVRYEASRLICRLSEHEVALDVISSDAVTVFKLLLNSNFALLQCEGAQALLRLTSRGEHTQAICQALPELVNLLHSPFSSDPNSKLAYIFVLQSLVLISTKGINIAGDVLDVVNMWALQNVQEINSTEDIVLALEKLQ